MLFGEKIRELRKKKNLSLRNCAAQVDVSPTYLSVIENNNVVPNAKKIKLLASTLDANEDELMTMGRKISPDLIDIILQAPGEYSKLIRAMSKLNAQQIAKMADALNSKMH